MKIYRLYIAIGIVLCTLGLILNIENITDLQRFGILIIALGLIISAWSLAISDDQTREKHLKEE